MSLQKVLWFNCEINITFPFDIWSTINQIIQLFIFIKCQKLTTWNKARYPLATLSKLILEFFHEYDIFENCSHCILFFMTVGSNLFPSASTHLKNFPAKNCTPMILKMSQNTRMTSSTLTMDGIAIIRAFTTICNIR